MQLFFRGFMDKFGVVIAVCPVNVFIAKENLPKSGCVDRMEVFSSQTSIYIIIIEAKIDQISHHISLPISVIQRPIFLVMFPRN